MNDVFQNIKHKCLFCDNSTNYINSGFQCNNHTEFIIKYYPPEYIRYHSKLYMIDFNITYNIASVYDCADFTKVVKLNLDKIYLPNLLLGKVQKIMLFS